MCNPMYRDMCLILLEEESNAYRIHVHRRV